MKYFLIPLLLITLNCFGQEKPKLVVGIVVDQMCYDYLYRFEEKFGKGGFKLLMEKGTNCRNTHYNYIPTYTGPGHASIYTGTTPSNHGIVGNEWFDAKTGKFKNCVDDSTVSSVGTVSDYGKYSPYNLKANTITDQLRLTYPDSKVIAMSIKNRGAILPGGHLSNGSYWFDYASGKMITSSFYESNLPEWVSQFNARKYADSCLQLTWDTFFDGETYSESEEDNRPYEHLLGTKTTPTFPYNLKEVTGDSLNYGIFTATPFGNSILTDFAIQSIRSEKLGQQSSTDFLAISYSSPDIIGHAFGPYSKEIEDVYVRLDREIERLIKELNSKVGKGNYTLFLTADHAVVPVPQYLVDKKLPGGYLFLDELKTDLSIKLTHEFGADLLLAEENLNFYLNYPKMDSLQLDEVEVMNFIKKETQKWEGVKHCFTKVDLKAADTDQEWKDMVRNGFYEGESGDVVFILKPGYLAKSKRSKTHQKGTSHGSAFNYDTHVPLLWYGNGIVAQQIFREVQIVDITATLAHILNLQYPNATTGSPILELFNER